MRSIFGLLCACLLLAACDVPALYPVDAEEEITLLRDGTVEATYRGQFRDIHGLLQALAGARKGGEEMSREEFDKTLDRDVARVRGLKVSRADGGLYQVEFRDAAKVSAGQLPDFLRGKRSGPLLSLIELDASERIYARQSSELGDLQGGRNDMPPGFGPILRSYMMQLRGTLRIRTDGRVRDHNADSMVALANGVTEYRWRVDSGNIGRLVFEVYFDENAYNNALMELAKSPDDCERLPPPDRGNCRLKIAKPGSKCQDLIGQNCKCGPFSLMQRDGTPVTHQPYLLRVGGMRPVSGCSDSKGFIPSVETPVTGECVVVLQKKVEAFRRMPPGDNQPDELAQACEAQALKGK